jgi:hypothetical protein
MWLEWEVRITGLDPATVESWRLDQLDLEPTSTVSAAAAEGDSVVLQGRSVITTGGASTLHSAIADWLKNEDAQGGAGEVDEATEAALSTLAAAVQNLDLATVALDGIRAQLLGFATRDGLARPIDSSGSVANPAPQSAPRGLLAGTVTLTNARLLDSFGRTQDVPVNTVLVPTRRGVPEEPGSLAVPPRLLRPARWQFRLVDAVTLPGTEGVEARVDEIQPALQVSPVAGFLLPDHLDESLEVFGVDGAPIGELLHEPVSGGVMWEIAAGREGPADAAPNYGLAPAQKPLADFAAALVRRYGSDGSFWTDTSDAHNPPYEPIVDWQIWNEPSSQTYYRPQPSVKGYAKLVKFSHDAITDADPEARIVLAGVFPQPEGGDRFRLKPYLTDLYRQRGLPKHFDSAALHPYARTLRGLKQQVKKVRSIMRRTGVAKKELWITEVGWGSDPPVPNRPLIKGEQGQKELLERSFRLLADRARGWNLAGVLWYSWRDPGYGYEDCSFCSSAGLLRANGNPKPAWSAFVDITGGEAEPPEPPRAPGRR